MTQCLGDKNEIINNENLILTCLGAVNKMKSETEVFKDLSVFKDLFTKICIYHGSFKRYLNLKMKVLRGKITFFGEN